MTIHHVDRALREFERQTLEGLDRLDGLIVSVVESSEDRTRLQSEVAAFRQHVIDEIAMRRGCLMVPWSARLM